MFILKKDEKYYKNIICKAKTHKAKTDGFCFSGHICTVYVTRKAKTNLMALVIFNQ